MATPLVAEACTPPSVLAGPQRSEESLRALAYELTVAEARERERIARGLHDDIGQILAVARYRVEELGWSLRDEPGNGSGALIREIVALLRQASAATRSATFDLCSPVLHQLGFVAAIEGIAQQVERNCATRIEVWGDGPDRSLPEPVLSVLFRVVRELVFNIQRHAQASHASVAVRRDAGHWIVCVADDGRGLCPQRPAFGPSGGYGLVSAEAQMRALGGSLTLESAPGRGTRVTLRLPAEG